MAKNKRAVDEANGDVIPLDVSVKRAKILDDSDSEDRGSDAGVQLNINEEFARRFEHNKKRAELHRLEEKYGKDVIEEEQGDESSTDETEDDEGEFATEALDEEISATLKAIRAKDPKVYDKSAKFFRDVEAQSLRPATSGKAEKPYFLKDYHRENLLGNGTSVVQDDDAISLPYAQQQRALKKSLVNEMHAAADEEEGEADGFLKPIRKAAVKTETPDIALADRDPETFLSNFLASRAWVPSDGAAFAALESDDEEDDVKAEAFEEYYNLRFEDPQLANQKLVSYARDAVAARSVRREEKSMRRKNRDREIARREADKVEREAERTQLRKLKMEEMEEKVKKIREAAGLKGRGFKVEEWTNELEADWDDGQWDDVMRKRFGEEYYAQGDAAGSDEEQAHGQPKKPKWDDDLDIKDLIPDFDEEEEIDPELRLTDDEAQDDEANEISAVADDDGGGVTDPNRKRKRDQKAAKALEKADRRRDQRLVAALVDQALPLSVSQPGSKVADKASFTPFRYRDTSPQAFGMSHLDILGATDAQLNEFAGLKKLAAFRDDDKKRKDKKKLGKKARLRQWRRDTFGNDDGPDSRRILGDVPAATESTMVDKDAPLMRSRDQIEDGVDIRGGDGEDRKKRKKKRGKGKSMGIEA